MLVLTIQSLFISYGIRLVFGLEVGSGWVILRTSYWRPHYSVGRDVKLQTRGYQHSASL